MTRLPMGENDSTRLAQGLPMAELAGVGSYGKSMVAGKVLGFGVDFQPRFVVSDCLSLSEHSHAASHTVLHL
jgi:hypothetical protein